MNKNTSLIAIATLAAGIAIGWNVKPDASDGSSRDAVEQTPRKKRKITDSETRIKMVTTVVTNTIQNTPTNDIQSAANRPRGFEGFLSELERMKKEEPARYASMTNRMAQFRNRIFQRAENKLTTLSSIDTTGWSKSQIENHENYQNLIARQHELMEIVAHDSGASREERDAAFREMREVGRNLRTAAEKERDTLLDRTFSELGFNKSDRKELRETIQTIYTTTEEWGGGHRGRGNGPRRR